MVRDVLLLGNSHLRETCRPIEDIDGEVIQMGSDLLDTLADLRSRYGFGRGLAAPQIGYDVQMVALVWPEEMILINPSIDDADGCQSVWDDCFSIPGLMMRVERAERVTVSFVDLQGNARVYRAEGDASELLQHELDHLDGVLAIDRVNSSADMMMRAEFERQRGGGVE